LVAVTVTRPIVVVAGTVIKVKVVVPLVTGAEAAVMVVPVGSLTVWVLV
jgi:hypothetical protein